MFLTENLQAKKDRNIRAVSDKGRVESFLHLSLVETETNVDIEAERVFVDR